MSTCTQVEKLEQFICGALPAPQASELQAHLNGCVSCQALLDRLYDNPELRRWAPQGVALETSMPREPVLAQLLDKLHASSPEFLSGTGSERSSQRAPLSFLAPPERPGELGTLGEYRVIKELGRGGMGVVLLAHDRQLQRLVALKVLRPDRADPAARMRFVEEARAAAGLVHDHVITIHAVIAPAEGAPYLVMQYVAGPTLRDRIKAEQRIEPRDAARLAWQVADGLAAAHAARMVHRDIKPSNVILDSASGRAKIVDFGLVRRASLAGETCGQGTLLGTPEYMSPEQVRAPDQIDARSDLYSLGVTLYEALTGEVPFRGLPHLVLQQILNEEPFPPRRLNDRVPRELEIICLKAMAKEASQRYQTAVEVRDDLGRWLNGEPIRARPVGPVGRLWRWCCRKPALASMAAALVLAVASGFAGESWRRSQAEEQRRLAETNAQVAFEAVEKYLSEVTMDEGLLRTDQRELRRRLLESARPYYQQLIEQRPHSLPFQAAQGKAYLRLAFILRELGSLDEAIAHAQQAQRIFAGLAPAPSADRQYQVLLANSLRDLGVLFEITGQTEESEQSYLNAIGIMKNLTDGHPNDPSYWAELARSYDNLGLLCYLLGRFQEAAHAHSSALAWRKALAEQQPAVTVYQADVAASYNNVGNDYAETRRFAEAGQAFVDALRILEDLHAKRPEVVRYQADLATTWQNQGILYMQIGKNTPAKEAFEKARPIQEALAKAHPIPQYQAALARSYFNLGILAGYNQPDEAESFYKKALNRQLALTRDYPTIIEYQANLATTQNRLGWLYDGSKRPQEAIQSFEGSVATLNGLMQKHPTILKYRLNLARNHTSLGKLYDQIQRAKMAEKSCKTAVELMTSLVEVQPDVASHKADLSHCYTNLGALYCHTKRHAEAEEPFKKALDLTEELTRIHAEIPQYAIELGGAYCNQGNWTRDNGQPEAALDWFARAIATLEQVVPILEGHEAIRRKSLCNTHWGRAQALANLHRYLEAQPDWDRAIQLAEEAKRDSIRFRYALAMVRSKDHTTQALADAKMLVEAHGADPNWLYAVARVYALAAAGTDIEPKQAEDYASQASSLLRQAMEVGFRDVARLKNDVNADFKSLVGRSDFEGLRHELEERAFTSAIAEFSSILVRWPP